MEAIDSGLNKAWNKAKDWTGIRNDEWVLTAFRKRQPHITIDDTQGAGSIREALDHWKCLPKSETKARRKAQPPRPKEREEMKKTPMPEPKAM